MSSHHEATQISKGPTAGSTDLYAFVSPDDPSTVTGMRSSSGPLRAEVVLAPGGQAYVVSSTCPRSPAARRTSFGASPGRGRSVEPVGPRAGSRGLASRQPTRSANDNGGTSGGYRGAHHASLGASGNSSS